MATKKEFEALLAENEELRNHVADLQQTIVNLDKKIKEAEELLELRDLLRKLKKQI